MFEIHAVIYCAGLDTSGPNSITVDWRIYSYRVIAMATRNARHQQPARLNISNDLAIGFTLRFGFKALYNVV